MGYDKGRRGRGRDKRDGFGEEGFDPFAEGGPPRFGGEDWRGGGAGGDRFGGGKISAADLQVVGDVIKVEQKAAGPQRELTGEKATGTVKFFNSMKGFGFITRDDGKEDAFVHISAVERSGLQGINEGDRFEFDLEVDRRGKFSAVNLVPVQG